MDTRTNQEKIATTSPDPEDPQPWTRASGVPVHSIGKGSGQPRKTLMRLELDLDAEQTQWLCAEGERTGENPLQIIRRLVDAARETGAESAERAPARPAT